MKMKPREPAVWMTQGGWLGMLAAQGAFKGSQSKHPRTRRRAGTVAQMKARRRRQRAARRASR